MSNTVKVRKGNKIRYVETGRLNAFLNQGYEQINEDGDVIKRATGGATVPIAKYNALLEQVESAGGGDDKLKKENATLKKENTALKAEIAKLQGVDK